MLSLFLALIDDLSDQELFINILDRYEKQMWYVANKVLNDTHYAEDAVQNSLLRISINIRTLRNLNDNQTRNYVLTAAKNAALDIIKKNNKFETVPIDLSLNLKNEIGSSEIDSYSNENYVLHLLNKLPPKYRDVMYMHFVLGMSEKEVAKSLGISINTVRQQIHRGRKKFAELYKEETD